jgi:hypothetical protein
MDGNERQDRQPALRPAVGVALVVGLVALVLGFGLLLRQASRNPSALVAPQTPAEQRVAGTHVATAAPVPTSTIVLAVAVPAATGTPIAEARGPVATALPQPVAVRQPPDQTPRPLVIGTLQTPPQAANKPVASRPIGVSSAQASDSTPSAADSGEDQASVPGQTYTGLPVAVPSTAVLNGAELPVGPAGVQSDGARAFARTLLGRARAQDSGLVDDPALRQVAEQALADQLTVSTPTGRVVPTRVRQGSVTVQIDIVATLPETASASLQLFPSASVPAIGVAVGIVGRVEPDYLPDLVAVAAVAYR